MPTPTTMAMAEGAMQAFLTEIGTFFTQSVDWATDILSKVSAEPALTVLVLGFPIVGFAFGLLGRLIRM